MIADLRLKTGLQTVWSQIVNELRFRLRLAQAGDFFTRFALAALFQERRAFKTLENITFAAQGGGRAETAML